MEAQIEWPKVSFISVCCTAAQEAAKIAAQSLYSSATPKQEHDQGREHVHAHVTTAGFIHKAVLLRPASHINCCMMSEDN